jgi:hypothetical protein
VSRRINILWIMFKIIVFWIFNAAHPVGILLTCGKHLHDCIISIRREVWVHNTSFKPRHFLLKCLYQSRKLSSDGINFVYFTWFVTRVSLKRQVPLRSRSCLTFHGTRVKPGFSMVCVAQSLKFCVGCFRSLLVLLLLAIVLSVLRFTASD